MKNYENLNNESITTNENNPKIKESVKEKEEIFSSENSNPVKISNSTSEDSFSFETSKNKFKLWKLEGKSLFVFISKNGTPLLIIGPQWAIYVSFLGTVSFLMLLEYIFLWNKIGKVFRILGTIIYWTYAISYSYTALINPGYPVNNIGRRTGQPKEMYDYCRNCKFYINKFKGTIHCYDCGICIEKYDHHCVWTGHCIGKNNLISFYIFVCSIFFILVYLASALLCAGAAN